MKKYNKYDPNDPENENVQVLSRNEPCRIVQVIEVIAAIKGIPIERVIAASYRNSIKILRLEKQRKLN
jgi:hypothetical protein